MPETESREPAKAHLKDALDELRAAREAGLADDGGEDAVESAISSTLVAIGREEVHG
jgi:hypothetical protein